MSESKKGELLSLRLEIQVKDSGSRLDKVLISYLNEKYEQEYSRSFISDAIKAGQCRINGALVSKTGTSLREGDIVEISLNQIKSDLTPDANVDFEIIYEDDSILVINKPAGLVVHPAPGVYGSTLVHGILHLLSENELSNSPKDKERPGIVHRLDKDTSGLMVVAKTALAKRNLQDQLQEPRTMNRVYHAICIGQPSKRSGVSLSFDGDNEQVHGTIDTHLMRHPTNRVKYTVAMSDNSNSKGRSIKSRRAISHFRILRGGSPYSLYEFKLETGRTHQIRVHAEYLKTPILGDPVYGPSKSAYEKKILSESLSLGRQMLHARKLSFKHPITNQDLEFHADCPADFMKVLSIYKLELDTANE